MQIDTHKKVFTKLFPNEDSSDINVSSLPSSQIVNFYRDNLFPDMENFEEGYRTAEDENISNYKEKAYQDKVLVRNSQYWDAKMEKLKDN